MTTKWGVWLWLSLLFSCLIVETTPVTEADELPCHPELGFSGTGDRTTSPSSRQQFLYNYSDHWNWGRDRLPKDVDAVEIAGAVGDLDVLFTSISLSGGLGKSFSFGLDNTELYVEGLGGSLSVGTNYEECFVPTECEPNYFGDLCWPCQNCNNGECNDGLAGAGNCTCNHGWTGEVCDLEFDECINSPCLNRADCYDGLPPATELRCECFPGYSGPTCADAINECLVYEPCQNGGTCYDGNNTWYCDCPLGWGGTNCTEEVNIEGFTRILQDFSTVGTPSQQEAFVAQFEVDMNTGVGDSDRFVTLLLESGSILVTFELVKIVEANQPGGYLANAEMRNYIDTLALDVESPLYDGPITSKIDPTLKVVWTKPDNPCSNFPCQNGGSCDSEADGSYTCSCLAGYTGTNCETWVDPCAQSPCQNGALCLVRIAGYECRCAPGFTGSNCEIELNECESSPCENGARCFDKVADYSCDCEDTPGFTGKDCEIDIDECNIGEPTDPISPCQNGATCQNLIAEFNCLCPPGFTDETCSTNINECASGPCENDAPCVDLIDAYRCDCFPGYVGFNCETDVNECAGDPCQNGATCNDLVNKYSCTCVPGYVGFNCTIDVNECESSPCENGSTCFDELNRYRCLCVAGYNGTECQFDINECAPSPCLNGATCNDLIDAYSCDCVDGFVGQDCEIDVNECAPSPCQNGATCNDLIGRYRCDCVKGYEDINCATEINECAPSPCQNGGTCVDLIGLYQCICPRGFTDYNCSTNIDDCSGVVCDNGATCVDGIAEYTCACPEGYAGYNCTWLGYERSEGQGEPEGYIQSFECTDGVVQCEDRARRVCMDDPTCLGWGMVGDAFNWPAVEQWSMYVYSSFAFPLLPSPVSPNTTVWTAFTKIPNGCADFEGSTTDCSLLPLPEDSPSSPCLRDPFEALWTCRATCGLCERRVVYSNYTKHYYELVISRSTWTHALYQASQRTYTDPDPIRNPSNVTLRGYLGTTTSEAENAFVIEQLSGNVTTPFDVWLGGRFQPEKDFIWEWVAGPEAGNTGAFFHPFLEIFRTFSNWAREETATLGQDGRFLTLRMGNGPGPGDDDTAGKWIPFNNTYLTAFLVEYGDIAPEQSPEGPQEYDLGRAYSWTQANDFCNEQGRVICPLTSFCDLSPELEFPQPIGGQIKPGDVWTPVANAYNEWTSIGTRGSTGTNPRLCQTYSDKFGSPPEWGDDTSSQLFKGAIRCCPYNLLETEVDDLSVQSFSYFNYSRNEDVFWYVEVPPPSIAPGGRILLSFQFFELEAQGQCRYDRVTIFNRRLGLSADLVTLCGGAGSVSSFSSGSGSTYYPDATGTVQLQDDETLGSVFAATDSLFIYFHSDQQNQLRGLNVLYRLDVPRPVLIYPLQLTEMGTGLVTVYSFASDTFENPPETDPIVFSAVDRLGFPLPDWLVFDPIARSLRGTPAARNAGQLDVRIIATNAFGYTAEAPLLVDVVLLEEPDSTSELTCDEDLLITPDQFLMGCQILPKKGGAAINTTADRFQSDIIQGLGGFASAVEPARAGRPFDGAFGFIFQAPLFGGSFALSDSVSADFWEVIVDAVPDETSALVCDSTLAAEGQSINCTITSKLFRASAFTTTDLLFAGTLSPPDCVGPGGVDCGLLGVTVGPVFPQGGVHTQSFSFSVTFGNQFGSYILGINSQRNATVDVWTQADTTTQSTCVTQLVQYRSVSCSIDVQRDGANAFAPRDNFVIEVEPPSLGVVTLAPGQADIASQFFFDFQANDLLGTAVVSITLSTTSDDDGKLVTRHNITVSVAPDDTSELFCGKSLVYTTDSTNCRIISNIQGVATPVLVTAFSPSLVYLSDFIGGGNPASLGPVFKYLEKDFDPFSIGEQYEFQFFPGDASVQLQVTDGVSKDQFSITVLDDPDDTSSVTCPQTATFGSVVECVFQPKKNIRPVFIKGDQFRVLVEVEEASSSSGRQVFDEPYPLPGDDSESVIAKNFAFEVQVPDATGVAWVVVKSTPRTFGDQSIQLAIAQILVTDEPDQTSSISCESSFTTAGVPLVCTIVPRLSGQAIYTSSSYFNLEVSGSFGEFSQMTPAVGTLFEFTYTSLRSHASSFLSDGVSGNTFQLGTAPPGRLFSWTADEDFDQPTAGPEVAIMLGRPVNDDFVGSDPVEMLPGTTTGADRVVQMSCSSTLCWALTSMGNVLSWGWPVVRSDSFNQLRGQVARPEVISQVSLLDYDSASVPPGGLSDFNMAIAVGASGTLWGWPADNPSTPILQAEGQFSLVSTKGPFYMAATPDGTVLSWGYVQSQSTYLGRGGFFNVPLAVVRAADGFGPVSHLVCGPFYGLVVAQDDAVTRIISWGSQLENTVLPSSPLPQVYSEGLLFEGRRIVAIEGTATVLLVLVEGGDLYSLSLTSGGENNDFVLLSGAISGRRLFQLSVGKKAILAADEDGAVWVWPPPEPSDPVARQDFLMVSVYDEKGASAMVYSNYYQYASVVPPVVEVYPPPDYVNTVSTSCAQESLAASCCVSNFFKCGQLQNAVQKYNMEGTTFLVLPGIHDVAERPVPLVVDGIQVRGRDGSANTTIDCQQSQCFELGGVALGIEGLQLCNGTGEDGGALEISEAVELSLTDVEIHLCSAVRGGAVANSGGRLELYDCHFHDNNATDAGGALYVNQGFTVVQNTLMERNKATTGGAVQMDDTVSEWDNVVLRNNIASLRGGGAHAVKVDLNVNNCQFVENFAPSSGGLYVRDSDLVFLATLFEENSAETLAGGMLVEFSVVSMSNSRYVNNSVGAAPSANVQGFGNGGAVYCQGNQPFDVADTDFIDNEAGLGGAAIFSLFCSPNLLRCNLQNNKADVGGACLLNSEAGFSVLNSSFTSNVARRLGGAVAFLDTQSYANLTSTLMEDNRAGDEGGAVYSKGPSDVRMDNLRLERNSARAGGAFFWTDVEPAQIDLTYTDNVAVHGPRRASQAKSLAFDDPIVQADVRPSSSELFEFPLNAILYDYYDQVVESDSSTAVSVKSRTEGLSLIGTVLGVFEGGRFSFSASTGTAAGVAFRPNGLASVYLEASFSFGTLATGELPFRLRECVAGEFSTGDRCNPCTPGTFTSSAQQTACEQCGVGTFANTSISTFCYLCDINTFADREGLTSCTQCSAGKTATVGKRICSDCLRGRAAAAGESCKICPVGRFANEVGNSDCKLCPSGKFGATEGLFDCTPCPSGSVQPEDGADRCLLCDLGKKVDIEGQRECSSCLLGQFANVTGQTSCLVCPAGRVVDVTGATGCNRCEPGKYQQSEGLTACLECRTGTFSADYGRDNECEDCPAGRNQAQTGRTNCTDCPAGFITPDQGEEECEPCKPGEFIAVAGQTRCEQCPEGKFTDIEKATACRDCAIGEFTDSPGQSVCESCPLGKFSNVTASVECLDCGPGKFLGQVGGSVCTDCEPGSFADTSGEKSCALCAAGFFNSESGQTTCGACDPGSISEEEGAIACKICEEGKFTLQSAQRVCQQCGQGRYSNTTGRDSLCDPCPKGTASVAVGQTSCALCAPGLATGQEGQIVCSPCDAGKFMNVSGGISCYDCPSGKNSADARASSCDVCEAGRFNDRVGQQSCNPCPLGTFNNDTGRLRCDDCPSGAIAANFAQLECDACEAGKFALASGQKECLPCEGGKFTIAEGGSSCTSCPAGKRSATRSTTDNSTDGTAQGGTSCVDCLPGEFSPASAQTCSSCALGSISAEKGAASCLPCPEFSTPNNEKTVCLCFELYYDVDPSNETVPFPQCELCPSGADCTQLGTRRNTVLPRPNFAADIGGTNQQFFACNEVGQCLGGKLGCAEGYEGNLCSVCEPGYGRSGKFNCAKCLEPLYRNLLLAGALIMLILVSFLFIRTTVNSAEEEGKLEGILLKIVAASLQFNSLARNFEFEWPATVDEFLENQEAGANVGTSFLSIDCFIQGSSISPFYISSMMFAAVPPLIIILPILAYGPLLLYWKSKNKPDYWLHWQDLYTTTIVVLLLLVHPYISRATMMMFRCKSLGTSSADKYLQQDLREKCYTPQHYAWLLFLALPMAVCYVIGIPLTGASLLIKNKRSPGLHHHRTQLKYAFLFKAYSSELYYWEFFIMARKVLLVAIEVFASNNVQMQGLLVVLLIIVAMMGQLVAQPFQSTYMNLVELLSLVNSFVTFFTAMFFFVNLGKESLLWFTLVIIGSNAIFYSCVILAAVYAFHIRVTGKLPRAGPMTFQKNRENAYLDYEDSSSKSLSALSSSSSSSSSSSRHSTGSSSDYDTDESVYLKGDDSFSSLDSNSVFDLKDDISSDASALTGFSSLLASEATFATFHHPFSEVADLNHSIGSDSELSTDDSSDSSFDDDESLVDKMGAASSLGGRKPVTMHVPRDAHAKQYSESDTSSYESE